MGHFCPEGSYTRTSCTGLPTALPMTRDGRTNIGGRVRGFSILATMDLPDPVEAIKFVVEQRGLTVKDLEPAIGRPNRIYEVLNRTRPLTLAMIRNLHAQFWIPAEVLIAAVG